MIKTIRSYVNNKTDKVIHPDMVVKAMEICTQCTAYTPKPSGTSYHGVYYSPPENGKSNALNKELFIGLDTDWLITMLDFQTVIEPFIKLGIPVITNQYHLAQNAGDRFLGMFSR